MSSYTNFNNTNDVNNTLTFIKQISNNSSIHSNNSEQHQNSRKYSNNSNHQNTNFNKQSNTTSSQNASGNDSTSTISTSEGSSDDSCPCGKGKERFRGDRKHSSCCSSSNSNNMGSKSVNDMVNIINYNPEILSKVQEYNKICAEVKSLEASIKTLHNKKFSKQNKIDDLRGLLCRIATEDSFTKVQRNNNCFISREKRDKKKDNGFVVQGSSVSTTTTISPISIQADDEERAADDEAPINQDHDDNNKYNYHFNMCSIYWQENFMQQPSLLPLSLCKLA